MARRECESPPVSGPFPKGWKRVIRNPPGSSPWITPPPSRRSPLVEPAPAGPFQPAPGQFQAGAGRDQFQAGAGRPQFQAGPSPVGTGMFPLTPGIPPAPGPPRPAAPPRPSPSPRPEGSRRAPRPLPPGFEFDRPAGRHRQTQPGDSGLVPAPAGSGSAGRRRMIRVAVPTAVLVLG